MDRLQFEADGEEILCPGGNGVISGAVLARRGIPVTLVGQVGEDAHGETIRQLLRRYGVDISRLVTAGNLRTKVARINVREDGTWYRRSAEPEFFPYLYDHPKDKSWIRGFRHLHVAGLQGLLRAVPDATLRIIQLCRANGLTLSFGLTLSQCDQTLIRRAFRPEDLIIGTANEFVELLERETCTSEELIDALKMSELRNCAVTLGPSGVLAKWRGAVWGRLPARSVVPWNSLGAGDVFAAVMVAEILKGRSISSVLRLGASAASQSLTKRTWDQRLAGRICSERLGEDQN